MLTPRISLNQVVELLDLPTATVDADGQPSQDGASIGMFHCSIQLLRGRDVIEARQMWPTAMYVVELPWLGSAIPTSARNPLGYILPGMKLRHLKGGVLVRVFNVLYADEAELRWRVYCEVHSGAVA